jgi:Predicted transcriptional regulator
MPKKQNRDMTAVQKGLKLFTLLLLDSGSWSLTDLAKKLECSKQTILRLVDQIEGSGWGQIIEELRGNRKYYRLAKPSKVTSVALTTSGLSQLTLCHDFLAKLLPEGMQQEASDALLTASYYLPEKETRQPSIGFSLSKGRIDYAPFEDYLRNMAQAIYDQKAVEILYQKDITQEPESFLFAPKKIVSYRESIYLAGWRVEKKTTLTPIYESTLALQRIRGLKGARYSTVNIKEPGEFKDESFGVVAGDAFVLKVKFKPEAATYVQERIWSDDQKCQLDKSGHLTLTMTSRSVPETLSWILSFGASAKLVSPDWLVDDLRKALLNISASYKVNNG